MKYIITLESANQFVKDYMRLSMNITSKEIKELNIDALAPSGSYYRKMIDVSRYRLHEDCMHAPIIRMSDIVYDKYFSECETVEEIPFTEENCKKYFLNDNKRTLVNFIAHNRMLQLCYLNGIDIRGYIKTYEKQPYNISLLVGRK